MVHMITYNLNRPGQDYVRLTHAIKRYNHFHIGGSNWLIKSNLTAIQIRDSLSCSVDQSDELFVCDFHNWASCNLPTEIVSWLKS